MISKPDWLDEEQWEAASHDEERCGKHAVLIAGPGTGKTRTLTGRAWYLIERGVPANQIVVLTFTRVAAAAMRDSLNERLFDEEKPNVATLHSYSLRQLLFNQGRVGRVPQPVRVSDPWETRHIVMEDLKKELGCDIEDVKDMFRQMESNWERVEQPTLLVPEFERALRDHKSTHGYILLEEMVTRLRECLVHEAAFLLQDSPTHILVDEFQDLNPCDIMVIQEIARRGASVFAAGDDDQSIYGWRNANPLAIREFGDYFHDARQDPYVLTRCHRCPKKVLDIADWVIHQSKHIRYTKELSSFAAVQPGTVYHYPHFTGINEADAIAMLCQEMVKGEHNPYDILILLRQDHNRAYSRLIEEKIRDAAVPVASSAQITGEVAEKRQILIAYFKLLDSITDLLAWRTLFRESGSGVGAVSISNLLEALSREGKRFGKFIADAADDELRSNVTRCRDDILHHLELLRTETKTTWIVRDILVSLAGWHWNEPDSNCHEAIGELVRAFPTEQTESVESFISAASVVGHGLDQSRTPNSVNIMRMHRAKGLTSRIVIIAAAEDELIPTRNASNEREDEDCRLLYVSLSRLKEVLIITNASIRTGQQKHQKAGATRTFTRFLRNAGNNLLAPFNSELPQNNH
jgi:DNA helicase-2/ATP-dependent DNA helicase PcrA